MLGAEPTTPPSFVIGADERARHHGRPTSSPRCAICSGSACPSTTQCDYSCCCSLLDLDRFKAINDRHGRLGGEEFAVFLPGATLEKAAALAETLRGLIAELAFPQGRLAAASFGVVRLWPGEDMQSMTARADHLLYEAKRVGRNRVAVEQD